MLTNYLQGVGTFGVLQAGPNPAGATLFVCSLTGLDNRGRVAFPGASSSSTQGSVQGPQVDPSKPLATLAYALTFCKASRGDVIILQQGHAETLAASVTCSLAGVQIIGLGTSDSRPVFTMAGFSIVLSGVGCILQNVNCVMGTTANTAGAVQLTGAGSAFLSGRISGANVTSVGCLLGAARTVFDSELDGTTTGFATGVLFGVFDACVVGPNSNIHGIFANAPIVCVANTNMLIIGAILRQLHATVKPVITGIVTTTSGLVANCRFQSKGATTPEEFLDGANVATNILVIYTQNFGFKGKAGPSSGVLIPAVGTIP